VNQYVHNQFTAQPPATIGGAFIKKTVSVERRQVVLQLWDTAGQERFRSMAPMYYRGAHAAILVFDATTPESLNSVDSWAAELADHGNEDIVMVVAANKADLLSERDPSTVVDEKMAQDFAQGIGANLFYTSAKTGEGITDLFRHVSEQLVRAHDTRQSAANKSKGNNPHLSNLLDQPPEQTGCC
jgi:small GTP-binding protein